MNTILTKYSSIDCINRFLLILSLSLNSCTNESINIDSSYDGATVSMADGEFVPNEKFLVAPPREYDLALSVYTYDSVFKDSSLTYQEWYLRDSFLQRAGEFLYPLPLQSEFADNFILDQATGEESFSTFNALICEVGGKSAYNKYTFKYDSRERPVLVKHYKAYYEDYDDDGNPITHETPDYFLNDISRISYSGNTRTQTVENADDGEIYERIVNKTDSLGRLVYSEYSAWGAYFFRAFYVYGLTKSAQP